MDHEKTTDLCHTKYYKLKMSITAPIFIMLKLIS